MTKGAESNPACLTLAEKQLLYRLRQLRNTGDGLAIVLVELATRDTMRLQVLNDRLEQLGGNIINKE